MTSQGVTIDQTPPTFGHIWLHTRFSIAVASLDEIIPHWELILDGQSSISKLYWCLGSDVGTSDLHVWKEVNVTDLSGKLEPGFDIPDGQLIRLNVLVCICCTYTSILLVFSIIYTISGFFQHYYISRMSRKLISPKEIC